MVIQCQAEFKAASGYLITKKELMEFLDPLPLGAVIEPIMKEMGSQRDPWQVFVGVKARWSETRDGHTPTQSSAQKVDGTL